MGNACKSPPQDDAVKGPDEYHAFGQGKAKGGEDYISGKTAILLIEYQNEFTTEKGKMHDAVKADMEATNMLPNTIKLVEEARTKGIKIIHAPISWNKEYTDTPNRGIGILAGAKKDALFEADTWYTEIVEDLKPKDGDLIVTGKHGLNTFPGTDLEKMLLENRIEALAIGGFLTNCCVESTVRSAYEKGFNVVTLSDCTAATSAEARKAAVEGSLTLFSKPLTSTEFLGLVKEGEAEKTMGRVKTADASRTFQAADAKGDQEMVAAKTGILLIEFQNEFMTENGKLYDGVKDDIARTNMLANTVKLAEDARAKGIKIFHIPISWNKEYTDLPNQGIGILAGAKENKLFTEGEWGADFKDELKPKEGDIVVTGKKALDAFPYSSLEDDLVKNGIETVAIGGFLTNCCVESTVRTAYEKGFNVVTLTDCTAATSEEGRKAAVEGSLPLFSQPLTSTDFLAKVK